MSVNELVEKSNIFYNVKQMAIDSVVIPCHLYDIHHYEEELSRKIDEKAPDWATNYIEAGRSEDTIYSTGCKSFLPATKVHILYVKI